MVNPSEHQAYSLKSEEEEAVKPFKPATVASGEAPKNDTPKDKGMKTPGAFPCSICDYVAKTEQGLKVHMTRSHPESKEENNNEKKEQEVKKAEEEKVEEAVETPEIAPEVAGEVRVEVKKEE